MGPEPGQIVVLEIGRVAVDRADHVVHKHLIEGLPVKEGRVVKHVLFRQEG